MSLRAVVTVLTITNNSHTGTGLEVVLGWISHVVKFFSKESTYKVSVAELKKCLVNVLPIIEGQDFAILAFSFF